MRSKLESSGRGEGRKESSKKHQFMKNPQEGGIPEREGHFKVSEAG